MLSLLVDPIRGDLGISDTQVSLLLGTAFAVVYGVAGIPLGFLADRTSRRNLIFAGVLVWSCGTLACGFSHSFGQLFAARIVVGLGEAVLSPAAISLISDYFPPSRRGTAVGFFLSGIAMGIGAAILIGGGVLHLVESLAHWPVRRWPDSRRGDWCCWLSAPRDCCGHWRYSLIREPARKTTEDSDRRDPTAGAAPMRPTPWARVIPIYLVVATASLVDNAVGAWAPTLLIREFTRDPAQIGVQLGLPADRRLRRRSVTGRLVSRPRRQPRRLVLQTGGLPPLRPPDPPGSLLINASEFNVVLLSVPLYFALSGIVTACGFSAILDVVPNRSRGLAMSISFFLNVALGAGLGPSAVTAASDYVFGAAAGLGPALTLTVAAGYAVAAARHWQDCPYSGRATPRTRGSASMRAYPRPAPRPVAPKNPRRAPPNTG